MWNMPRKLRVEHPGAIYRVMNRGDRREIKRGALGLFLMFVAGLVLVLTSCSHTHVGDGAGTSSPDGKFHLAVSCDGANGRSYTDKTRKKIWIGIRRGNDETQAVLLEDSYTVTLVPT
jgi:hypothetical protein